MGWTMTAFDPYGIGVMPPMRYSETFYDVRRWAWFNIGAFMMGRDTGYVHGPALPDLDGPNAAPMNYTGPMSYGDDGESRCYWDLPTTARENCRDRLHVETLRDALSLETVHYQGVSIAASSAHRLEYVARAEGRTPSTFGVQYWD